MAQVDTSQTITISTQRENVIVNLTRPGADGYQLFQSVIGPNGTVTVVQYAYNAAGQLVHIDPKFP